MDNDDFVNIGYYFAIISLIAILGGLFYYLFLKINKPISEKFEIRYQNKVNNFKEKIQLLENNINSIIKNEPLQEEYNVNKERELFEMYYKGVPDTYDLEGKLIKGVEPNPLKAINYLQTVINSSYGTEQDVLQLARIYHYGMHLFERDLDKAENIYNSLKFDNITNETRETIKEALDDIQKIRIYTWLNLPLERPTINPNLSPREIQTESINITRPITRPIAQPIAQPIIDTIPIIDRKNYNDSQNTHNPQVLSTIRLSLEKLKNSVSITKNQHTTVEEIRKYIYNLKDSDKKEDALKSLRDIEYNKEKLSSTDMSVIDVLVLVWNRINDENKFNEEIRNNLKETMFDELASMQEFGVTICLTGRFTRIIDTLNGVDEEVSIKPTYAINEEMMLKASNIREKMYEQFDSGERKLLESGTSTNQEKFDSELKKNIIEKLKEDYVNTGILTETKFNNQINTWINEI